MQVETIIAAVSVVVALLSVLYAIRNSRTAEKALALAVSDQGEKHESIEARLIDGLAWEGEKKQQMVAFACMIINRSTAPNTVVSTELHLHEFDELGQTTKLILLPEPRNVPSGGSRQPLPSPLNLLPRSTVSGWLTFHVPEHFAKKKRIDKYEVVFLNSVGDRTSVVQYLIRKVENAPSDA